MHMSLHYLLLLKANCLLRKRVYFALPLSFKARGPKRPIALFSVCSSRLSASFLFYGPISVY